MADLGCVDKISYWTLHLYSLKDMRAAHKTSDCRYGRFNQDLNGIEVYDLRCSSSRALIFVYDI